MKSVVKLAIALIVIMLVSAALIYIIRTGNFFRRSLPRIDGSKVLVVMTDGFDETEYFSVVDALVENGATVRVASFEIKELYGHSGGGPVTPDLNFTEANASDFNALFIPGGYSPANLLQDPRKETVLNLVQEANNQNVLLSAICHGPWILANASVVYGKNGTGHPDVEKYWTAAGGIWVYPKMVVKDGNLLTARYEGLTEFMEALISAIAE